MASIPTTGANPESPAILKQTFESAVHELGSEAGVDRAKQPIYPRRRSASGSSDPANQKRALQDAAEALAALWKTAGAKSVRKSK